MSREVCMKINSDALQHNFNCVRKLAPNSRVIAMVKANAYGHGLETVVNILGETDAFGVASLSEARAIRRTGVKKPIVIMAGFFSAIELEEISRFHSDSVIHLFDQIDILQQVKLPTPVNVWIKINTGMNRLGISPDKIVQAYELLHQSQNVQSVKFMTHFSDADSPALPKTNEQISLFNQTVKELKGEKSLANSAGILGFPESHADWVRPGLMLYGVSPVSGTTAADFDLKPVMTLSAKIMSIRQQKKGDQIGYGSTFICPEAMPVGIIAMGYGDGYPWHASNKALVLVKGQKCPLAGRVSMDMLAVDLRNCPGAKIGDKVTLWGEGLPVEHIAANAGTISYELLCSTRRR